MNVEYAQLSPTGNITVLVKNPVPRECHSLLAARLLEDGCIGGEQVGFIEAPSNPAAAARLQMMGGEFCGNASMSLAVLLARDQKPADGDALDLTLEVSGAGGPVRCRVCHTMAGWSGQVQMPLPLEVIRAQLPMGSGAIEAPLLRFPGIAHIVLPAELQINEEELRRHLVEWNDAIRADALGAMRWDANASSIDPLVYVPSAGTLVREHGCGSGTAAIGCMLALQAGKDISADIRQPGGAIRVDAAVHDGHISRLSIAGRVEILREGTVQIE